MKWNFQKSFIICLEAGLLLAGAKLIFLFFDFFIVLDLLVFFFAGYYLGKKVLGGRWSWGLIIALPSIILNLYFIYNNGFSNIFSGIGTSFLLSLFVVPFSSSLGIMVAEKRNSASKL